MGFPGSPDGRVHLQCRRPGFNPWVRKILWRKERLPTAVVLSHVQLFATPWTVARKAPVSMEFSRQEFWSGLPFPSPGDLPDPGTKPKPPALAGRFFTV